MARNVRKYLVCAWETSADYFAEVTGQSGAKATGKSFFSKHSAIQKAIEKLDELHEDTTDSVDERSWPKDWANIVVPPSAVEKEG